MLLRVVICEVRASIWFLILDCIGVMMGLGCAGKVPACACTYRICPYCRVHNVDAKKTASFVEFVWPRLLLFLEYSVIGLKR